MKSGMNKLMSLCLVAMMGTTLIPQPIQAEEVRKFEEELFEEATVEFEEATFEEESNQVAESSVESNRKTPVLDTFDDGELRYQVTGADTVEVIGFADGYQPTGYELQIPDRVSKQDGLYKTYTVTSIGDNAFKGGIPNKIELICLPQNLITIGESAFAGCDSFKNLHLHPSLIKIGNSAFAGCNSLKRVDFLYAETGPQVLHLKTIGDSAFAGCTSLGILQFKNSSHNDPITTQLETIGKSAFEGCTSLHFIGDGLDIFEHLKTIGDSAFKGCIGIRKISLPEGLKTIGDSAFELGESTTADDSPHLEFINIPSSVETLGSIFGDKNPFGSEYQEELVLAFSRETLPKGIENLLDVISKGNNKPTIYFPNTETAMNTYAGKESLFVIKGLINRDYFDSSIEQEYESVWICPGETEYAPNHTSFPWDYEGETLKYISSNPEIATAEPYSPSSGGLITAKSIGETIISCFTQFQGKELICDHNKFKVKVDHKYSWLIEKFPTADQPGSMFQYCVKCGDMKESVPIPPTSGGSGGGSSTGGGSTIDPNAPTPQVENAVYRAYNSSNGEHLYTTNYEEFKVITKNGWDDEGIAFMSESKEKGQAVYRVYNPNSGLHHYTTDVNEKNALVSLGWNDEGVAFYTSKNPKDTPVYRVYNENDGNHHYTMNANEALALISMGWKNEGIAFLTAPMK